MAGLVSGLGSMLGINTTAGTDQLQQALDALKAVGVPTTQQLTLPQLQQYVAAGVLSPSQFQAISANPDAYAQAIQQNQNTSGQTAEQAALSELGGVAQTGSTPIMAAQNLNNLAQLNQANQANNAGITENAQQRGVAGGGLEFIQKQLADQGNATTANSNAVNTGANNAQLALNAIAQQGTLGGQIQGQSNTMATNAATAAQQIAEYNSQLQSSANQYNTQNANQAQQMNLANAQQVSNANTGNANARTQYNAAVPQTVYQDQMQKATGVAGAYGNQANLAQNQAGQNNAFIGNLIGAGATVAGGMLGGPAGAAAGSTVAKGVTSSNNDPQSNGVNVNQPTNSGYAMGGEVGGKCYARGGEVHAHDICMKMGGNVPGEAQTPGNSPKNDTVPAMLSPHEIVLPRSVAQSPNAPQDAAKFVAQTKGQQPMGGLTPTVNSFAEALKKLEENGLELRLATKGS